MKLTYVRILIVVLRRISALQINRYFSTIDPWASMLTQMEKKGY